MVTLLKVLELSSPSSIWAGLCRDGLLEDTTSGTWGARSSFVNNSDTPGGLFVYVCVSVEMCKPTAKGNKLRLLGKTVFSPGDMVFLGQECNNTGAHYSCQYSCQFYDCLKTYLWTAGTQQPSQRPQRSLSSNCLQKCHGIYYKPWAPETWAHYSRDTEAELHLWP